MEGARFSPTDLAARPFARILLIKPSSLGDVIHALPVLGGLRARYPNAKIDWLIATSLAPLLEGHRDIDELIRFDRNRFARAGRSGDASVGFMRFLGDLRKRRYDLAIDLQGLFRSGFLAWASGARVRIGFRSAREGAWVFYTHRIRVDDPEIHAVDRNYRVADLLGFPEVPVEFKLGLPNSAGAGAERLLQEQGLKSDERLVAVAPGARWETKVWSAERFTETIDRLQAGGSVRCAIVGGPDEVSRCRRIADGCRVAPINLVGKTSLPELAAVIATADLVICHDSAAAHLATALERPLVCLLGPTNPRRTGPYRRLEDVVQVKLDCSPCYLRVLRRCSHDHRCMTELTTDVVVAAAERALARSPQIGCRG